MMRGAGKERAAFLILLAIGFALRLYRLGVDSLWYDETVSVYLAGSPVAELIRHTAGDIHPPGYYLLLRGWLILMGYPDGRAAPAGIGLEWTAGFFSVFFGVALIALTGILARRLAAGWRPAGGRKGRSCCGGACRAQPVQYPVQPGSAHVYARRVSSARWRSMRSTAP